MSSDFIHFARPTVENCEIDAVTEVLKSGWWTTGATTRAFELEFAQYIGSKNAIAVNSCTAGLHLAVAGLGLGSGDALVTTTYTFVATAEVALYCNAVPLFVDIDPVSMCMDVAQADALTTALGSDRPDRALLAAVAEGALPRGCANYALMEMQPRPRGYVPVHFSGLAVDMAPLQESAVRHDMFIVEDAAHALETSTALGRVGRLGDAAAFSFYATKNLSTGEGGMVTTDDDDLAERIRRQSLHGISKDAWKRYEATGTWYYEVLEQGYKYNMTDIAAALGLCQLRRADQSHERRCQIAEYYLERLGALDALSLPISGRPGEDRAWHLFVIRLRRDTLAISRDAFMERMQEAGIGVSVHFIPLHLHPFYRQRYGFTQGDYPCAEAAYETAVSLPIYPGLKDSHLDRICSAVEAICDENKA